jgi:ribosomal protein S18 acetylase RimI-like enzyme
VKVSRPRLDDVPEMIAVAHAADRAVYGDSDWIEEDLREWLEEIELEQGGWLVRLDGGRLGGWALLEKPRGGRLYADGYVEPELRGRGLGLALTRTAFARFWALGERRVALGVDAENPTGATRLYERAGMYRLWEAVVWEKQLN